MWGQFLCEGLKRSVCSPLPWDIPWYDPSHTVFFIALYGALSVIGIGLLSALLLTIKRMKSGEGAHH
ncbi:MAG: hypothetical protein AAGU11_16040 [Syntrophobacteraceae bacterium]